MFDFVSKYVISISFGVFLICKIEKRWKRDMFLFAELTEFNLQESIIYMSKVSNQHIVLGF